MRAFVTPPDRDGSRWRVEVWSVHRVEVYRLAGEWVSQAPLRRVRGVDALGVWLVERGIDPDGLIEV